MGKFAIYDILERVHSHAFQRYGVADFLDYDGHLGEKGGPQENDENIENE